MTAPEKRRLLDETFREAVTAALEDHARQDVPDEFPCLMTLLFAGCGELAERGLKIDHRTVWACVHPTGCSFKKRLSSLRSRTAPT